MMSPEGTNFEAWQTPREVLARRLRRDGPQDEFEAFQNDTFSVRRPRAAGSARGLRRRLFYDQPDPGEPPTARLLRLPDPEAEKGWDARPLLESARGRPERSAPQGGPGIPRSGAKNPPGFDGRCSRSSGHGHLPCSRNNPLRRGRGRPGPIGRPGPARPEPALPDGQVFGVAPGRFPVANWRRGCRSRNSFRAIGTRLRFEI